MNAENCNGHNAESDRHGESQPDRRSPRKKISQCEPEKATRNDQHGGTVTAGDSGHGRTHEPSSCKRGVATRGTEVLEPHPVGPVRHHRVAGDFRRKATRRSRLPTPTDRTCQPPTGSVPTA